MVKKATEGDFLPYAPEGEDPLLAAGTGNHGINLGAVFHDYETGDHRGPAISEIDGKRAGTIGIYRVRTVGWGVSEVGTTSPLMVTVSICSKVPSPLKSAIATPTWRPVGPDDARDRQIWCLEA